jgi:hypothetical protein
MHQRLRGSALTIAAAGLVAILVARSTIGQAQPPDYRAPRMADGTPNISGIWQALNTANWNLQTHGARPGLATVPGPNGEVPAAPVLALGAIGGIPGGMGVVEGEEIPYQPWAVAKQKENFRNALARDPEVKCFMPGVPRATYMPYPFQVLQSTNKITMAYEFANATRTIHMDKVGPAPVDSWMGHNVGRWEGETLVVDVTSLVADTWFDRAGNFHSDVLHVVERYTRVSPDRLDYEATIEDPKVFTRPWTIRMPLYRHVAANAQLIEYKCVAFVEELLYGNLRKRQVVKHWDEDLGELGGVIGLDVTRSPLQRK